ncbi:BQ5605_C035g11460 [Microbotryum silenes-dioicae]|uniref:BQ5605_C035g11460 protein n=1 Tax=Microbotryum silenes-dioicae TaxID=796604 RepID=A0A2X0N9H0_9BASI|nr:BQ5605_C039g11754 [Microbotryum silenes-dioicae]SGY98364.1 BQ5605_C035g11460 [Microbotryum silenes-dioicae]
MPVRFRTLFVSLERQCLLPLHSRNFSTLLLPAMTTASTSTNDHAALSSTESPAATIGGAAGVHVAPLLPPMQLSGHSGAPDTTAGTTYEGVLFGISAETIKWAKDRKDPPMSCPSRHQQVKRVWSSTAACRARKGRTRAILTCSSHKGSGRPGDGLDHRRRRTVAFGDV